MNQKIILHIDFDSFFASVEQQYHPEFRNKPLGITAANGRTAIIAASREAKKFGIKGRDRTYNAFNLCPWLLLTKANFRNYFEVSKKFLKIANHFSPTVELFSIDEVFIDITETARLFGGVDPLIRMFKHRVAKEIGEYITVSIGISYNKLLAKLASGMKKPNGVYYITPENLQTVYKEARLTDVCGIGNRIALRLGTLGIYTLLQLQATPLSQLIAAFGKIEGVFLKNVGLGIDTEALIPYTQAPDVKSVGRNYCLPHNEYNKRIIAQNIFELCEEVGIKLRRLHKTAQTIGLGLRGQENYYERKTVAQYLNAGSDIYAICAQLLAKWNVSMVRMISVYAANLQPIEATPLSLFGNPIRQNKLQETIDTLNERFGDHTIRNGFLLYSDKLTTVPNGWMADTYERTKLANENADS